MEKVSGGELVALMLKNEGVDTIFGIVDGSYLGLNFALRKHGIRIVTPRHEACAVHMAGAYARLTGRLGVCMASSGPGVANCLPGVVVEHAEGNRVLLITSSRRMGVNNPERIGAYQVFDQVGVIRATAKWSASIPSRERLPEFMKRAFRTSFQGRPGVVHVDLPEDIGNSKGPLVDLPAPGSYRRVEAIAPSAQAVEQAAELLVNAERPLIHAGSGVLHALACETLAQVAELLQAPVSASWGGRAAIPDNSLLSIPVPCIELLDRARNEADVVLVLGSRMGETDWWGKAPNWAQPAAQKMIQVDADEAILGCTRPAALTVLADVQVFLAALAGAIAARKGRIDLAKRKAYLAGIAESRKQHTEKMSKHLAEPGGRFITAQVPHVCDQVFNNDAIYVVDGGNTAVWTTFFHEVKTANTVLTTPKFGMLGAGVPQALGAAAALPGREICCIIGDGAMGFNIQEIETAVRNYMPIVFVVCCDKQWGMVKMTQSFASRPWKTLLFKSLRPEETVNTDLGPIAFDDVARAMGAHGERVTKVAELEPALRRALASGKCAVVQADVDAVKHMWAPNLMTFKKLHLEPKGR